MDTSKGAKPALKEALVGELRKELEKAKEELVTLRSQFEDTQSINTTLAKHLSDEQAAHSATRALVDTAKMDMQEAQSDLTRAIDRTIELEKLCVQRKDTIEEKSCEIQDLKANDHNQQHELATLRAQMANMKIALDARSDTIKKYKSKLDILTANTMNIMTTVVIGFGR